MHFKKTFPCDQRGLASRLLAPLFFVAFLSAFALRSDQNGFSYNLQRSVSYYIQNSYVNPDRVVPKAMLKSAVNQMELLIPEILVTMGPDDAYFTLRVGDQSRIYSMATVEDLDEANRTLKDIFAFLEKSYQGETSLRDIQYTAINGMLKTLDPHSEYLPPRVYNEFQISNNGNFGGIGIVIGIRNGELTVVSPVEGTPAAKAGIKAGDRIVVIDGASTVNMSLEEAVSLLRGEKGTKVTIGVLPKDGPLRPELTLVRDIIQIKSVVSKMLPNQIGYIRIAHFRRNTMEEFDRNLGQLKSHGVLKGLILDLRDDPGGLLNQAVELSDRFLKDGPIVSSVYSSAREDEKANAPGTEPPYPLAILVNEGSASGSEIVAGALKYRDRAILIGNNTFGKGSVQTVHSQGLDGQSALKLTIAKYLLPGDRWIQSKGIVPDITLRPARIQKGRISWYRKDDAFREADLEQHLEGGLVDTESRYTLAYLDTTKIKTGQEDVDDDEDGRSSGIYTGKLALEKDFHVQLASALLHGTKHWERPFFLKDIEKTVAKFGDAEGERIKAALRELGVDWSKAPQTSSPAEAPALKTQLSLANKQAHAGDELVLTLRVANLGQAPAYRVRGMLESDYAVLNQQEFVLGKLAPGQTRSWSATLKIPESSPSREEAYSVRLYQDDAPIGTPPVQQSLRIAGRPKPLFAYAYALADKPHGNGDGRLQLGEDVELTLTVQNIGQGASTNNLVTLKNLSGKEVFIKTGRGKAGALPPGAVSKVPLFFGLQSGYTEKSVNLQVAIMDLMYGILLQNKIQLPVEEAGAAPAPAAPQEAAAPAMHRPPAIRISSPMLGRIVDDVNFTLKGSIQDDRAIRHFYVYQQKDKVYFEAAPKGANSPNSNDKKELNFEVPLKLVKGTNDFLVVAVDDEGLHAEEIAIVTLADEKPRRASAEPPSLP